MLPQIETPKYKLELPSNKEVIEYRPFLVKEEKILLLALESAKQDDKDKDDVITESTFQIIKNCTLVKLNQKSYLTLILIIFF